VPRCGGPTPSSPRPERLREQTRREWNEAIERRKADEEKNARLKAEADAKLAAWVRLRNAWMNEEFLPALAEHVIWQATVDYRKQRAEKRRARWYLYDRWVLLGLGIAAAGGLAWWILS